MATERTRAGWVERGLVALLALATMALQKPLSGWHVDDAGISASYARNLANGFGLVAYPGGERVEGYSNPLWVGLLALGQLAGLSALDGSKVFGALLGGACVVLVWQLARRLPSDATAGWTTRLVPIAAALLVATNAQHVIWAAAGLENSLFAALLAAGTWRVLVESERGGAPLAAVLFLGVSLTRPEGVMYAAAALGTLAILDARAGRARRVAVTLATFALPFVVYHAARYAYFAFPFPTTYYVKLEHAHPRPLEWDSRAWRYMRGWLTAFGWIWTAPLVLIGVAGARGWRVGLVVLWMALVAGAIWRIQPGTDGFTAVVLCLVGVAGLPWTALGRPGGRVRWLAAIWLACTLLFALRAGGDWMRASRFTAPLIVPLALLYAAGLSELTQRLPRLLAPPVALALIAVPVGFNLRYLQAYSKHPEDICVEASQRRVGVYNRLADRVSLRRSWVALDHTQGGMTWAAPPRGRAIDSVGLTDVAFAQRDAGPEFRRQYLHDRDVFDFAHVVGGGGVTLDAPFAERFVQVPGYRNGRYLDNNTWIRRSLMTVPSWPGGAPPVEFGGRIGLAGLELPAPQAAPGGTLYVELGLQRAALGLPTFRAYLVLTGPTEIVLDVPLGYDGLLPVEHWRPDEVFVARATLHLPFDMPVGEYDVGVRLQGADGATLRVLSTPTEWLTTDGVTPRRAGAVSVRPRTEISKLTETDVQRALKHAASGDCEGAEGDWRRAGARRSGDKRWLGALDARVRGPLATCWSRAALNETDVEVQLEDLRRARQWDPSSASATSAGSTVADTLVKLAERAREEEDAALAREFFEDAVAADPRRAWARRYAEEAREQELTGGAAL